MDFEIYAGCIPLVFNDKKIAINDFTEIIVNPSHKNLIIVLETTSAYTPVSGSFYCLKLGAELSKL